MAKTVSRNTLKPVAIDWQDSCAFRGAVWSNNEDAHQLNPQIVHSFGIVIRETKNLVIIAGHVGHGEFSGELCIPRSAIIHRRKLK